MAEVLFFNLDTLDARYVNEADGWTKAQLQDYVDTSKMTPEEWVMAFRLERGCTNTDELKAGLKIKKQA